ncbi:MAG: AAA family ATPase, partial [bacterium]
MLTTKLNQRLRELQTPTPAQAQVLERELRGLQEQLLTTSQRMREQVRDPIPLPLPSLPQTFVGRVTELEILRRTLRQDDNPLTLIVAPAGFGKTTLVTKLLSEVASAHRLTDPGLFGVLYLSCQDGTLSLERVFSLAGRMLGREETFHGVCTGRGMPLAGKLAFFFGELSKAGTAWLVLDNLESLLREDDSFRDPDLAVWFEVALSTSHSLRLIVTSRSVPRFPGSEKLKPPALSRGLDEDEAILYLRREGAECGLADAPEELLRTLVRRLDGIPKALESVVGYLAQRYPV